MAKTTALSPRQFASEGAVKQDGSLKIYTCNTCGREVVWAKSSRTGRFYLVNVSHGRSGARFYIKKDAHDCAKVQAERAEFVDFQTQAARVADWQAEMFAKLNDLAEKRDSGELTIEEFKAAVDALDFDNLK